MALSVQVEGQREIRERIKELGKKYPRAMAGAIYKLGVAILGNAIPRVPVEFGVLRSSAYVSPPEGQGVDANVELGFGTEYAVPQHERTDYKHPRGGEAKFLEKAIDSLAPSALTLLAQWCEQLQKSGSGWGGSALYPGRPQVKNSNRKSKSQGSRLKRAARNVRRRTGR